MIDDLSDVFTASIGAPDIHSVDPFLALAGGDLEAMLFLKNAVKNISGAVLHVNDFCRCWNSVLELLVEPVDHGDVTALASLEVKFSDLDSSALAESRR